MDGGAQRRPASVEMREERREGGMKSIEGPVMTITADNGGSW
jgi:hypothetical protein